MAGGLARAGELDAGAAEIGGDAGRELMAELVLELGIPQQPHFDRIVDERGLDQHRRELHRFENGESGLLHAAHFEAAIGREMVEQRFGEQLALLQRRGALDVVEDADQVVLGLRRDAAATVVNIASVPSVKGR